MGLHALRYFIVASTENVPLASAPRDANTDEEVSLGQSATTTRAKLYVPKMNHEPDIERIDCDRIDVRPQMLLFSKRAIAVLHKCRIPDIGFVPTDVFNRAGRLLVEYDLVYQCTRFHDVLDHERSLCKYWVKPTAIARVFRWVLDPSKIPEADLFRAATEWLATDVLREACERHSLKGFKFVPVWSHENGSVELPEDG
jgi:hypothetical protein